MVPCPRGKRKYERARASPADVTWHTRGPTAAARVCIRTATSSAASRLSASLARVRSPHGYKYLHRPRFKSPECLVRNRYRVPKRLENSRFIRFYRYYSRTTTRAFFFCQHNRAYVTWPYRRLVHLVEYFNEDGGMAIGDDDSSRSVFGRRIL